MLKHMLPLYGWQSPGFVVPGEAPGYALPPRVRGLDQDAGRAILELTNLYRRVWIKAQAEKPSAKDKGDLHDRYWLHRLKEE